MKKTSIYLDAELDYGLNRLAKAQGLTKAEAIRQVLRRAVQEYPPPRITAIGVMEGPGDLSENLDKYLEEGFGRD
jgi:ribbon-helix-helix CopG family protein